jgi:predicted nuclease of predicted toxin-antitoxin system
MRFLADESCDFSVVRALRGAGHDVSVVTESARGADDSVIMERARDEARLLLTEDRDFGQLVFAAAKETAGVVYIRWPVSVRSTLPATIVELVATQALSLFGAFVIVEPGRIRIGRVP